MNNELKPGLSLTLSMQVEYKDTAANFGSGLVPVFATPAMIAFMEKTCLESVQPFLPEGFQTVGTFVSVSHTKATLVGKTVSCFAQLQEVNEKELVFNVIAKEGDIEIGSGIHKRFIINYEKFLQKLKSLENE